MKIKILLFAIWLIISVGAAVAQSGGNFTVTQTVIASGGGQNSSGGNFTVGGTIGQSVAGTQSSGANFNVGGGFWINPVLQPTTAQVSIGGRVMTVDGSGIRNIVITLIAPNGTTQTNNSSTFGYYRFENVEVGQVYILSIRSKRFVFLPETRVISVNEELTDLDWIAENLEQ